MTPDDRMPDRLGPYRLLDRIGEGGMGVVYLARDAEHRSVAIKVLRPSVAGDPNARRRLAREVETMRLVRSPFVAEVLDTDVTGDMPYIVTQYVPGRTLDDVVREDGPVQGAALARLACGLAKALAAVHGAGVVHRDLKPGNVMMVNGEPVVIDFGIAQALDSTRLTMTGMFMGTPGYLSPEVIEGQQSSRASDVHAWGATVAFAATGRPPFGTGSYETIFYRIVNGSPDLTGVAGPMLPLLTAALGREPAHRPSAEQLGAATAALDPSALISPALTSFGAPGTGGPGAGGPGVGAPLAAAMTAAGTRADGAPLRAAGPGLASGEKVGPGWTAQGFAGPGSAAPGLAGPGITSPGFAGAAGDAPGTRPIRAAPFRPGDYADMLPPVSYGPAGAAAVAGRAAGNGGPAGTLSRRDWPAGGPGAAAAGPAGARHQYPLLVIATMVIAASVSVLLPVAGTLAALAVLVLLRAGALAQRGVQPETHRRRGAGGQRPRRGGRLPLVPDPVGHLDPAAGTLRARRGGRGGDHHDRGRAGGSGPAGRGLRRRGAGRVLRVRPRLAQVTQAAQPDLRCDHRHPHHGGRRAHRVVGARAGRGRGGDLLLARLLAARAAHRLHRAPAGLARA